MTGDDGAAGGLAGWRTYLVEALRREGLRRLCAGERVEDASRATQISQWLTCSMFVCLVVWLVVVLHLSIWQAGGAVGVLVVSLVLLLMRTGSLHLVLVGIVGLWLATGVASLVLGGLGLAAGTHVLAFVLIALVAVMWRTISLARRIPFLLPVALLVVFLPLLTEDLWAIGAEIGVQLAAVGIVAVGPPLVLLIVRYWRVDVAAELAEASESIGGDSDSAQADLVEVLAGLASNDSEAPPLKTDDLREFVRDAYEADSVRRAVVALGQFRRVFRRRVVVRLVALVGGVGVSLASFIFVLAWAAIPIAVSSDWSGVNVQTTTLAFAGLEAEMPTSPYVEVAVLLAIVATAAFLAFALTEDHYSAVMSRVLVSDPARLWVLLAAPYLMALGTDAEVEAYPDVHVGQV